MEVEVDIDLNVFLPKFRYLLKSKADIHLLWGGRDSGKSDYIASKLIMDCMSLDYFRCILIKKTFESIKDAQWQTIKDVAERWGVDHLFTFNKSPLEIICYNGNKFIARGCDNPVKLKSISNPSHAWYEEGNQLTLDDYIVSSTTLRSAKGEVRQWFSFNPEADGDYEDFWLYKIYFENRTEYNFEDTIEIEIADGVYHKIHFTSTHSIYTDNPYCTDTRKAFLESLASISPYYYKVYTEGLWGNPDNKNPWAFAYDENQHTGYPEHDPNKETYLSFDFNRNPYCVSVIQHMDSQIRILEVIKLQDSNTDEMCDRINILYPNALFIVTGDATGTSMTAYVKDNLNHYQTIQNKLGLSDQQLRVPSINPALKDNQMLFNLVLAKYNLIAHKDKAKAFHFDCKWVKKRADGTIEKGDRDDPTKQADALDTVRYWINVFMADWGRMMGLEI